MVQPFQKLAPELTCIFIPGPFYDDPILETASGSSSSSSSSSDWDPYTAASRARDVWDRFKSNLNQTPREVAILGIYNALQRRFGESLCAIGWRSGSLDGASFLGIPIFSLDNVNFNNRRKAYIIKVLGPERVNDPDEETAKDAIKVAWDWWLEKYSNAQYLVWPYDRTPGSATQTFERMEEASYYLDTSIIIFVPNLWGNGKQLRLPQKGWPHAAQRRSDVLKFGKSATTHLSVALYVWACNIWKDDKGNNRPYWVGRCNSMKTEAIRVDLVKLLDAAIKHLNSPAKDEKKDSKDEKKDSKDGKGSAK